MKILSILTFDPSHMTPPSEEHQTAMSAFVVEMKNKGILLDTGGAMDGNLELKMSRKDGTTSVTDVPNPKKL
ncbi:MAG: hypothetical protein ABR584_10910 [Candidatus Baltobacteraceae bacterium]